MAVLEDNRHSSEIVLVDTSNKEEERFSDMAYPWNKASSMPPMIVIMDPAMTKVYGSYNSHVSLSENRFDERKYRKIHRDAMKAHKEDVMSGRIINPKDQAAQVERGGDPPASVVKKFENSRFEDWTSRAGSTISAKLTSASQEKATFVDRNGREIELRIDQLDEKSANRVKSRM